MSPLQVPARWVSLNQVMRSPSRLVWISRLRGSGMRVLPTIVQYLGGTGSVGSGDLWDLGTVGSVELRIENLIYPLEH